MSLKWMPVLQTVSKRLNRSYQIRIMPSRNSLASMVSPDVPDSTMVSKILGEINMNERDLDDAVVSMKQWVKKQPHLPPAASDEDLLKAFIIGCESTQVAKNKLDNFFTFRNTFHDPVFKNRDTSTINWKAATNKLMCLPGMTEDGCRALFGVFPDKDEITYFTPREVMRARHMQMEMYIREKYMMSGIYMILDATNLSLEFVMKASKSGARSGTKISQESYPLRTKRVVIFNAHPLAETFMNTFLKRLFNKELQEKWSFHSEDHKVLSKYIPLEMLPSDYAGGKSPSIQTLWVGEQKKLQAKRDWFLNEGSQSVNESLRPRTAN